MFDLDEKQKQRLDAWNAEQDKIVLEYQRRTWTPVEFEEMTLDGQFPYYGAIGGHLTYKFTPTGIGTIVAVYHSGTQAEINLTDYESW